MSLKAFHIFFVTASILLAIGFGGWAAREWWHDNGVMYLLTAIGAFICGVALLIYGKWFLEKLKGVK